MAIVTLPHHIICAECGILAPRRGPVQKYCEKCSEKNDLKRKQLWKLRHPSTTEQRQQNASAMRKKRLRDKPHVVKICGQRNRAEVKQLHSWFADHTPDLQWITRISMPFDYVLSKNHIYTSTRFGHVALRRESRLARDQLTLLLRGCRDKVKQHKLWIDILVQKPDHHGDAVNVIDLVCDAIKDAIGLDDRWFCIRRLDWQIVKDDPQLFVGIGQEECMDSKVCSYCGLILPKEKFGKAIRECKDCRAAKRKQLKEEREKNDHAGPV